MFLVELLIFIIFQLLIVYPLGKLVLNFLKIKLWWVPNLVFSLIIGIVFLTLFVFVLGYTNHYNLLPFLIIIPPFLLILQVKNISFRKINVKRILGKSDLIVVSAIGICVLTLSTFVFPNGITAEGELRLKGVFTQDAMWHIGIINNLKEGIPPEIPIYAGEKLVNYHYFVDLYITVVQKFTGIDILTLYFKLIGPFLGFLLSVSLYFLINKFVNNKLLSSFGVLLVLLSSTYFYVFNVFMPGQNISDGTFWGNGYSDLMINYPLTFSYLIITCFLFLILSYKNTNSPRFILTAAFLLGIGMVFKSYGAVIVVLSLYIISFLKSFKRDFVYLKIALLSSVLILILTYLVLQNNRATQPVFIFNPFWMIATMFNDPLRINSLDWEIQRRWFLDNRNYFGAVYLYVKGIAIFLFANLGLKVLGFLSVLKKKEEREKDVIILISIIAVLGIIASLLFTQGGVEWNTIQFFYYSVFSLGLLFVLLLVDLKNKLGSKLTILAMFIVWISYLPGVYRYSEYYLSKRDNLTTFNFRGTQETFEAARFLSSQDKGILLIDSKYLQTPFVVAISKKNAYLADPGTMLPNLLIDWHERNRIVEHFFSNSSTQEYKERFLKENNISYIFTSKDILKSEKYLDDIFSNNEVSIYKVKQ